MLFQELIALPTDVFGPVDFLEFFRLASTFRGDDPFEEVVSVGVDSMWAASEVVDSA